MKESAKRRRSKQQIREDKEEEKKQKEDIQAKLLAWNDLEAQLQSAQARLAWAQSVEDGINNMMDNGVIEEREDGSIGTVNDPARQEHIKSKRQIRKTQMHQQHESSMS